MTVYYIRITDDVPEMDDETVWFKLDSNSDELYVVDKNSYDLMRSEWEEVRENLTDSSILTNAVDTLVTSLTNSGNVTVSKSINANYLQDSDDDTKKYDYDDVKGLIDDMVDIKEDILTINESKLDKGNVDTELKSLSQNPVQNNVIKNALDSLREELVNSLNSLLTRVSSVESSLKSHVHTGWTYKSLNSYSYIYYNPALRLVQFHYYRQDVSFTQYKSKEIMTIPSGYRPYTGVKCPTYNPTLGCLIGSDGVVMIYPESGGKKAVNISCMYFYKP